MKKAARITGRFFHQRSPDMSDDAFRIALFFLNGNLKDTANLLRHDGALALDVALALIHLKKPTEISRLRDVVRA